MRKEENLVKMNTITEDFPSNMFAIFPICSYMLRSKTLPIRHPLYFFLNKPQT